MQIVEISDKAAWDRFVTEDPHGHPLQLWGWGEAKRGNGWTPHRLVLAEGDKWLAGAEVLLWSIPKLGGKIAYVPRGPVGGSDEPATRSLLEALVGWAKTQGALYLRIEPAWREGKLGKGWLKAKHHLQLPETYTLDLNKTEDELLEPMSRKHRQYIRKSERDGVTVKRVQAASELGPMFDIYTETAGRAGFGIHTKEYYETLFTEYGDHNYLYYAEFEGHPVAFLWLAAAGATAYELYGGVTSAGGEIKANYLLKWQAISKLKAAGYRIYDFNGRLNEGVSRFKDGFGPDETDYIGTYDFPMNKAGYHLWEHLWPVAKIVGRRVAKLGGAR